MSCSRPIAELCYTSGEAHSCMDIWTYYWAKTESPFRTYVAYWWPPESCSGQWPNDRHSEHRPLLQNLLACWGAAMPMLKHTRGRAITNYARISSSPVACEYLTTVSHPLIRELTKVGYPQTRCYYWHSVISYSLI
jgi:hypothetical protein